jgi:hypothetical protein
LPAPGRPTSKQRPRRRTAQCRRTSWRDATSWGRALKCSPGSSTGIGLSEKPNDSSSIVDTALLWRHLEEYLGQAWELPTGRAQAGADDALHLWDTAGFFVADGTGESTHSRLRLFAELGAAMQATGMDSAERASWLADRLTGARSEAAVLAAGLSAEVAAELIDAALQEGSLEAHGVAARAVREGARPDPGALSRLAGGLIELMKSATGRGLYRVACELAHLPVFGDDVERTMSAIRSLPDAWRAVPEMLAMVTLDAEAAVLLETARSVLHVNPRDLPASRTRFVDREYDAALLEAARRVIQNGDDDDRAVLVVAMRHVSEGAARRIDRMLQDAGHGEAGRQRHAAEFDWVVRFMQRSEATQESLRRLWTRIAGEPEQRRPGAPGRRLSALGDLLATMGYDNWGIVDLENAVSEAGGEGLETVMRIIAELAGLSWDDIAADAAVFEDTACEVGDVADGGTDQPLTRCPADGRHREIRERLVDLLSGEWLVAVTAAQALARDPDKPATLTAIERRLATPTNPRGGLTAEVAMAVTAHRERRAEQWFAEGDGPLRVVAAAAAARLLPRGAQLRGIVLDAVVDPDASVRNAALTRLRPDDLDAELRGVLERSLADQPAVWTCPECGRSNRIDAEHCASCGDSAPQWHWRARDLLGERVGVDVGELLGEGW